MVELRTETKMPEDRFGRIDVPRQENAQIIDATLSPEDHINEMLVNRLKWGKETYYDLHDKMEARATIIEQRREAESAARAREQKAAEDAKKIPYDRFLKALRMKNATIEPLLQLNSRLSLGEKIGVLAEFQRDASRNALSLKPELISFGMHFLLEHISAKLP